jgi:hypothetical protein
MEMIDALDTLQDLNDRLVGESFKMISTNLFRTFANKSKLRNLVYR